MKNKLILTILSSLLLLVPTAYSKAEDILGVQFERTPLFEEANFVPGEAVSRWIKVTDNASQAQEIGIEVTNFSGCSSPCLADVLDVEIYKGLTKIYEHTLREFYGAGEVSLGTINPSQTVQYDLKVTFQPGAGDDYQGLTTTFDFQIGTRGETEPEEPDNPDNPSGPTGGGGGGAILLTDLEIFNERVESITENTVVLTWQTNLSASSRVVYSSILEGRVFNPGVSPNYGYSHSTVEDSNYVTTHQVTITGLTPGTTYFSRVFSKNATDFAISTELSFVTPTVKGETTGPIETTGGQAGAWQEPEEEGEVLGESTQVPSEENNFVNNIFSSPKEEEKPDRCKNLWWIFVIVAIVLALILERIGKSKKKIKWIFPVVMIILIAFYRFYCCWWCKSFLLIVVLASVLAFYLLRKQEVKS